MNHLSRKKLQDYVDIFKINKALNLVRDKITTIVLDGDIKVKINTRDKSIWMITPDENIPLPVGEYGYKDKLIIVDPEAVIKDIKQKPIDTLTPKINKLSLMPDQMKKSKLYQLLNN